MERYIGLDAHSQSCTFAVLSERGKQIKTHVVETNGQSLVEFLKLVPGRRHLCFEEGTSSQWLYEILSPYTHSIAVVRTKNRIKSFYRSRGVPAVGRKDVYDPTTRDEACQVLPSATRYAVELLSWELDRLEELKAQAEKAMLVEARKHLRIFRLLKTAPGIGPIRAAQLLAVVVSPHRFRTSRQFWSYCGLAIVTRSSADWVQLPSGQWVKSDTQKTRGLNKNRNPMCKAIFKGAANTVFTSMPSNPLHADYQRLLEQGTNPNLATLTIARKIAALTLAMWKNQEAYDLKKCRQRP